MLARLRRRMRELRPSSRPRIFMMPSWFATDAVDSLLFVISALEEHGFTPVAHKGLLLGALRLQGLLPWDDEADACLLDASTEALDARLKAICREHGFTLRFRRQHGYFFAFPTTLVPFAHAGLTELGLLMRTADVDGAHFDAHEPGRHLRERELLPLRQIPFYGSWLPGPANPEVATERMSGAVGDEPVQRTSGLNRVDRFLAGRTALGRAAGLATYQRTFQASSEELALPAEAVIRVGVALPQPMPLAHDRLSSGNSGRRPELAPTCQPHATTATTKVAR